MNLHHFFFFTHLYILYCFGSEKSPNGLPYPLSIALVLIGCSLVFSLIAFVKGGPSSILAAVAKSGFTAAFSLIFVSEIGDKVIFLHCFCLYQTPFFFNFIKVLNFCLLLEGLCITT